ncbi:MAG: NAD(P)/FAD-dependent oxidoreductase [Peptococcaceae bacterium]|nr:NAD(P)/FAD-dependent oxidoreductase [Peptococcaceae bacterium]
MTAKYDIIVVGGGHNGLTAACYLQKAGYNVLVLERLNRAGGGAWTEEATLPGFKHNLASVFHGILHLGPVYKDLELQKYGAEYIWPDAQVAAAFTDGRCLVFYRDLDKTCQEIARFSEKDAETYRSLATMFRTVLDNMIGPWFFSPPVPNSISSLAFESSVEGLNMMRMQLSNPKNIVNELFESNAIKSLLLSFIKEFGGAPDTYGFGVFVPMMLGETHYPHGWAICKGGSGNLARAFVNCLEDHGGTVMTNAEVKKILVDGKRATGVQLADGTVIEAGKLVLTNLEPHTTFLKLIGEEKLEPPFIHSVKRWRKEDTILFHTHLALDEPLKWKCAAFNPDINRCLGVLLIDEPQEIYDDFAAIDRRELPPKPRMFTAYPSVVDPSQAPPGKATAIGWQYVPYNLREGGPAAWDEVKEEFAARCIKIWSEYVENMDKSILKHYAMSPLDTERLWTSMVQGGFNHGEMSQDQLTIFRPFVEYKPYRTPFENLYMCGASTHPSGSMGGACGYNAVQVIADDLKIKNKWWE